MQIGGWWRWALVSPDEWRPAGWSLCLSLSIFPRTIKSRSSLLAPAHPGRPGKRAVKRLWWWLTRVVCKLDAGPSRLHDVNLISLCSDMTESCRPVLIVLCCCVVQCVWCGLTVSMQSQSSRPVSGWTVRRGTVLQAADRRMLQAVRDNLSHVRYAAAAGTLPRRQDADVQNGSTVMSEGSLPAQSRLHYNKKALDEIRQSLQSYHVTPGYSTSHSGDHVMMLLTENNKVNVTRCFLT